MEDLGYRFWWEKGQCWLGHPNGTWTQLAIHNYVPFLEPPLEPGSDSEYSAIVNWCVSCLGEDNPVLNNVLQDLAQTWPEYTAFVADARRRRATQKGPQPGPPGAAPDADAQVIADPEGTQVVPVPEEPRKPVRPQVPRRRDRFRYEGALELAPTAEELLKINREQVAAWIPIDHWLDHLPAHASCASCDNATEPRRNNHQQNTAWWGCADTRSCVQQHGIIPAPSATFIAFARNGYPANRGKQHCAPIR